MGKKIVVPSGSKLLLCVFIVFITSFTLYFLVTDFFPTNFVSAERDFYSQTFSNDEKIVLIGSSHVGMLNATYIQEKLENNEYFFDVYNLAHKGDIPTTRINTINDIIALKPKLVVYGISFRDLNELSDNPLPDPKRYFHDWTLKFDVNENPKLWTLEKIRIINPDWFALNKEISIDKTPFMTYDKETEMQIIGNDKLTKQSISEPRNINLNSSFSNAEVSAFIESVNKLKKHNIPVVIYLTPLHKIYRNEISETQKIIFTKICERISNETDTDIIDLSDRYDNLEIWANISHVAFNKNSLIYSGDMAEIIKQEIEK